jgi:hypothetical protein
MTAASTTAWPSEAQSSWPVVAARASSEAWYSGERAISACSQSGSWDVGKKVPENRKSGMTATTILVLRLDNLVPLGHLARFEDAARRAAFLDGDR